MGLPIMLPLAAIGGLLARARTIRSQTNVFLVMLLPFVVSVVEKPFLEPTKTQFTTSRTITIDARPSAVWKLLMNPGVIRQGEYKASLANRIGVPEPQSAFRIQSPSGVEGREVHWKKGVRFEEYEVAKIPHTYVRWDLLFSPTSFPNGTMDEHVVVGGRYFDVPSVSYALRPVGNATELTLTMHYRLNTHFNFYAQPMIQLMLNSYGDSLLEFYKHRAKARQELAQR